MGRRESSERFESVQGKFSLVLIFNVSCSLCTGLTLRENNNFFNFRQEENALLLAEIDELKKLSAAEVHETAKNLENTGKYTD